MTLNRKTFYLLGLVTLFGFSALGALLITWFHDFTFLSMLSGGPHWTYQVFRGSIFGVISALCLIWLVQFPILRQPREFFTQLIRQAGLRMHDLLFLSLAAGIGEEILFRAAIQPFLGIWLTALIFVALHGYLNPFDLNMSLYGVLLIVVSAGMGYLFEHIGIYAAISAHFFIDCILFIRFNRGH